MRGENDSFFPKKLQNLFLPKNLHWKRMRPQKMNSGHAFTAMYNFFRSELTSGKRKIIKVRKWSAESPKTQFYLFFQYTCDQGWPLGIFFCQNNTTGWYLSYAPKIFMPGRFLVELWQKTGSWRRVWQGEWPLPPDRRAVCKGLSDHNSGARRVRTLKLGAVDRSRRATAENTF